MKTNQEVFNQVVAHLAEQQEKSYLHLDAVNSVCAYRDGIGKNGKVLTCAIGCLIPADFYDSGMELAGLGSGLVGNYADMEEDQIARIKALSLALLRSGISRAKNSRRLLQALQSFHDNYWSGRAFTTSDRTILEGIADTHNLAMPPL